MNVLVSDKKVSPEAAQAYQTTTSEEQQQIQLKVAAVIQSQIAYYYKKIFINSDSQVIHLLKDQFYSS